MLHCSGMRWREVARSLIVPACCCVLNLFLFVWARMPPRNGSPLWDQVAPVAALLSAASACVLLALPAGLALILLLGRRAHYGRMEALRACRVTYRVATGLALLVAGVVWTAVATTITLWNGAPPMWVVAILGASAVSAVFVCNARGHGPGPTVVLLNLVWVAYVGAWFWDTAPPLFVVSALSAAASVAILALTADIPDAGFEIPRVISLRGRPAAADGPRALRPLIAVVSRTVGVPPPAHVLFTLDAETAWVPLDVVVGDDTLAGGTLCVSLPMCRVLERGELAGLVAFELAYEKAVPLRCRRFISVAITRLSHHLNRASRDLLARSALSAARMPLELWREMWGASHAEACLGAVQRAAVVLGPGDDSSSAQLAIAGVIVLATLFHRDRERVVCRPAGGRRGREPTPGGPMCRSHRRSGRSAHFRIDAGPDQQRVSVPRCGGVTTGRGHGCRRQAAATMARGSGD